MRRDDFNKLSKELQTEFLDRGGKVEGLNAPSNYMSYTIRWNREQLHGNNKRPMTAKTRKYLNKLKYS